MITIEPTDYLVKKPSPSNIEPVMAKLTKVVDASLGVALLVMTLMQVPMGFVNIICQVLSKGVPMKIWHYESR
jgi:hypothetical protein